MTKARAGLLPPQPALPPLPAAAYRQSRLADTPRW